jgi:thymidylate synthase
LELCRDGRIYRITEGSCAGSFRIEFDFVAGTIYEPVQYTGGHVRLPLAVTVPQGVPQPTTDADIEEYFVNYIMDGNLEPNEHYRYSTFIVGGRYKIPEIKISDEMFFMPHLNQLVLVPNQLQWCINHYKQKGFGNNHCCISVSYPESNLAYDIPYTNESERQTSPCLRLIDTKIIKDEGIYKLCINCYFRSWDLWGGFPVNIGGLSLLQEYMAGELGVEVGSLSFTSKGLHVYSSTIEPLMMKTGYSDILDRFKKYVGE